MHHAGRESGAERIFNPGIQSIEEGRSERLDRFDACLNHQSPSAFSFASSLSLQSMHWVVTGLAFRRWKEISSPQVSQIPNVPFSILSSAFLIFLMSLCSRSRILSSKF
jgi:hypothetical protein